MPTIIKTLGDQIQFKRFEKGLSQSGMAKKVDVSSKVVKAWEEDKRKPNQDEWRALVNLLDITTGALERTNPTRE